MSLQLRVQNFRSHQDKAVVIPTETTVITGPNGSGKTSLMEAIYLAFTGKSWRSNFDEILKRTDNGRSDWWRIDLSDDNNGEKRIIKYQRGQKIFQINDKQFKRLPSAFRLPVVLFEPNDMQLLYGSPTRRRQFIDRFISQLEPIHQTELNKFERVLKQRNNLLKQDYYNEDEMIIWNIQFSSLSSKISNRRHQYLKIINKKLENKYQEIAGDPATVKVRFNAGAPADQADILRRLESTTERITPVGAQKDDYKFIFNGSDAKVSASRGENRTIIFAVLGTLVDLARTSSSKKVLVLLDDIDSELDQVHRLNLYNMSSFKNDTIATTLECSSNKYFNIDLS